MKKRDFLLITAVFVLSAVLYFLFAKGTDKISVYSDGELWGEYLLSKDSVIDVNGTNIIVIEGGKAYMKSATCPDKLCQKQGKIGADGGSIICLPNKVVVENKKADTISR